MLRGLRKNGTVPGRFATAAVVVLTLALAGVPRPSQAQFFNEMGGSPPAHGNIEGFTVAGKGHSAARPNRLEIDLEVSAASELSADAIVKYRDAKKRLEDAFAALKLENVTVEERGLLVDQKGQQMNPYFWDYQPNRRSKTEVQLTRRLVVKCGNIRKLDEDALLQLVAKLLDVAQDAGGRIVGSNQMDSDYFYYGRFNRPSGGLVRFILDDYDKLEEEAYEKAIADAQARAQRLAKLSHVKLGAITAVRETSVPADRHHAQDDEPVEHKHLESARFQDIAVRVELLVRFESAAAPLPNGRSTAR